MPFDHLWVPRGRCGLKHCLPHLQLATNGRMGKLVIFRQPKRVTDTTTYKTKPTSQGASTTTHQIVMTHPTLHTTTDNSKPKDESHFERLQPLPCHFRCIFLLLPIAVPTFGYAQPYTHRYAPKSPLRQRCQMSATKAVRKIRYDSGAKCPLRQRRETSATKATPTVRYDSGVKVRKS